MRLAYLLSEYPILEHTYLLREVRELRALGWEIQTVSIRRSNRGTSELSADEREELHSTWYVLGSSPLDFLKAHAATLVTRPLRYIEGLVTAWRFGRFQPRTFVLATAYFIEAVLVGYRLQKAGINHVHSVYSTTVAWILSRIFDIRISMTIHGSGEFVDPEGFRIRDKVRASQFVCAISYFGKSQLMLWSSLSDWQKLEVAPLGVDVGAWQRVDFREQPAPFELLSVGRISEAKGYPLLLDAVALLTAERRNVRLTLVGDGPGRAELEDCARRYAVTDRVIFAGWKSQKELREVYRKSDLCVLSSFAEGIPVVLMEAMATGLPCVAPRITGIPELIRDGVDGLLFTPSKTGELASAIGQLIDNPELRRRMAQSCRERIADQYDLHKNTLYLSEVFTRWILRDSAATHGSR